MYLGIQDRLSVRSTVELWDRQDGRHCLHLPFEVAYKLSVAERLTAYASPLDRVQACQCIAWLESHGVGKE